MRAVLMSTPLLECSSMPARRLLVLALLAIAPAIAACGTMPTANDDSSPSVTTDTTKRKENMPWN